MPWNAALFGLRDLLAFLYPDKPSATQIVVKAGLPLGRIELTNAADSNWFNILEEADRRELISALVETACDDFPNRCDQLFDAYNQYQLQIHTDRSRDSIPGPPPASASALIPNATYRIVSKKSGKCLDVQGLSGDDGANVQQYPCHAGKNQMWRLIRTDDDLWFIIAVHSGKCLDVKNQSTADQVNVQQYQFHGGDNQKWELIPAGDGYYRIRAKHSGKCLDVEGASTADSANVQQYQCHHLDNQKWKFELVEQMSGTQLLGS